MRATVDRIFADGQPQSIIVIADYGPGFDKVRVAAVGPKIDLNLLMQMGADQLKSMLKTVKIDE